MGWVGTESIPMGWRMDFFLFFFLLFPFSRAGKLTRALGGNLGGGLFFFHVPGGLFLLSLGCGMSGGVWWKTWGAGEMD
jgi:hypothetical protein